MDSGDTCDAMVYLSCVPKEWTLHRVHEVFKFKGERNSWRAVRGVTQVKLRAEFRHASTTKSGVNACRKMSAPTVDGCSLQNTGPVVLIWSRSSADRSLLASPMTSSVLQRSQPVMIILIVENLKGWVLGCTFSKGFFDSLSIQ